MQSESKTKLDDLKLWSDQEIVTFVQDSTRNGETLISAWNETPHPETMFIDFYDEVMSKLYTDEEKEVLFKMMIDDGRAEPCDEEGHEYSDLDALLEDHEHLCEDAAEDCDEINPKYKPVLQLYMFKWLMKYGDEFLLAYINDEPGGW